MSVVGGPAPHRTWGAVAVFVYGAGAVGALVVRRCQGTPRARSLVRGVVLAGAALAPLISLLVAGQAQEEVQVVERSAIHLIERGTPYPAAGLTGHDYQAYNPYLPGMALLGLPQAVAGVDARVVFAAVFALTLTGAVAVLRAWRHVVPLALVAASPLVTMTLAVGGDDLPVLGLACLGLALAARDRPGWAGLTIGLAASLKATGWPVAATFLALVVARGRAADDVPGRSRGGMCATARAAAAVGVVMTAGVVLPALADAHGFFTNVVAYPLGLTSARSPAESHQGDPAFDPVHCGKSSPNG
jgi:hypothetical protein